MSDPTAGADALDLSENSPRGESPAVNSAATLAGGPGGALAVGRRWHNYTVKSELPGPPAGCFLATDVSVMQDVIIQMRPIGAEGDDRREVWQVLQELPEENFTRTSEAREESGFRYEIFPIPTGQSLREWLGAHRTNAATIELGVQQIARGIEALHQAGLVHLNLRPETIFIEEGDDHQLKVIIGGLHKAQLTDHTGLVAIEVNPYYAPPEAGGLFQHEAGASLRAWDWWALGRIVQEMVLGRHVYSLVMERDVRANPPELRARAEALLLERDPTALRAGAVELLPEDTGSRLRLLLRGLLASVREGRWRWSQVDAWARGDQPIDRYDLPRNTRLILRAEQALTLTEIADLYAQPAYFAEGVGQLFPADGVADTVWSIVQETPQFRAEFERVRSLREMMAMPPWQGQPVALCQAAVAGLVWLTLAAAGQRRPLCFGEYALSVPGLRRMFREGPAAMADAALAVLTAEPYLQRVSSLDPAAKKALDALARPGREAVAAAKAHGWISDTRPQGLARLLEWVLASDAELQASRDALRTRYAICSDARLDAWLRASAPSRVELALLAVTGENPGQHGYVPHEEWSRRRHGELMARAGQVSRAIFWHRLERMIVFTPALLGFWAVGVAIWLVPLALALMAHAWLLAALTGVLGVSARVAGPLAVRRLVVRHAPGSSPWRWTDQAARCRRERLALMPGEPPVSLGKLKAEMARIHHEIGRLTLPAGMARPADPARCNAMWVGAVLATVAPVVLLSLVVVPRHMAFSRPAAGAAAASVVQAPVAEPQTLVTEVGPDGQVGLYEIVNDGFGGHRRGPLKLWDVPKPAAPPALKIFEQTTASGAQCAFATVSAELLLAPYPRQGRKVLVAVAVPRPRDARPSIVLYDSATGKLADGWSYGVGSALTPSTWYTLTGREVVYLGLPEAMRGDDLIPLP
jgi:hypothetical protein